MAVALEILKPKGFGLRAGNTRRTSRKRRDGQEPEAPRDMARDELRARRDTANRILTDLKAALNCAAMQRKTAGATPWREVKPFQEATSQRVRFLNVAEQRRLVAACDTDLRPVVMGALTPGGRYGEFCKVLVSICRPRGLSNQTNCRGDGRDANAY